MVMCRVSVNTKGDNMGEDSPDIINLLSDLEEGELEEISDVSSDEEMLLRQRIEILENYNSMLEKKYEREKSVCRDPIKLCRRKEKRVVRSKPRHVKKKRRTASIRGHVSKHRRNKKKRSSSESEIDVYSKKILRDAIGITSHKVSQTSLKNRLFPIVKDSKILNNENSNISNVEEDLLDGKENVIELLDLSEKTSETEALCDVKETPPSPECHDAVNNVDVETDKCDKQIDKQIDVANTQGPPDVDNCTSEDDAEILRQLALNSKSNRRTAKVANDEVVHDEKNEENKDGDGSDSDITELRIIALRSAMLKKAMERKRQRKESRRRRNSKRVRRSVVFSDLEDNGSYRSHSDNTDIEEVDMDVDQDTLQNSSSNIFENHEYNAPQDVIYNNMDPQPYLIYPTDGQDYPFSYNDLQYYDSSNYFLQPIEQTDTNNVNGNAEMDVDLEEDEDILRAKLLNSISSSNSKNVQAEINLPSTSKVIAKCDESNLIIRLGASDLESDCEETKQLIKTNQKIVQETAFQRSLDMFLKTARSKVENTVVATPKRPVAVVAPPLAKKHTPLAVKHLPAADQQEYRQLVKRMSELQNIKMAKQQQAMINDIASRCNNHDRDVSVTSSLKQNDKTKRAAASNKEREGVKQEILEKEKKLTKTIELHLELTRKKIFNHNKLMKRLEAESRNLQLTCDHLKTQAQEIEIALRNTRVKLSDNQRLANNTNRNLSKLQKHEEILRNKIKNISTNLNRSIRSSVNQTTDGYSTKITMKNKVINKKPNVAPNEIASQRKVDNFVKPAPKTFANNVAAIKKATSPSEQKKDTVVTKVKSSFAVKTYLKIKQEIQKTVVDCDGVGKDSSNDSKKLNSVPIVSPSPMKTHASNDSHKHLDDKDETCSIVRTGESAKENHESDGTNGKTGSSNKSDTTNVPSILISIDKKHIKNVNEIEDVHSETVVTNNLLEAPSLVNENVESSDCNVDDQKTLESNETIDVKTLVDGGLKEITKEPSCLEVTSQSNEDETEKDMPVIKHSISNTKLLHLESSESDYKSPLHVLKAKNTWSEDAQAIFCPFEVGGSCKDPECKYFHPKSS